MLKTIPLLALALILISGCVERGAADAKLTKGCAAGAETLLDEGFEIKETKAQKFQTPAGLGKGYREVILTVVESDGWHEGDKTYNCIFYEEFGPLNMSHRASIYQIRSGEEIYGKEGEKILGSLNDWLKLSEAVETKMNIR